MGEHSMVRRQGKNKGANRTLSNSSAIGALK